MIASLSGRVAAAEPEAAVIDVGGVGYLVQCSSRTLSALPAPGEPAALLVETHVREDRIDLYGFASAAERARFRLLVKVQGVGARMALGVLSAFAPDELDAAVAAGDRAALRRAPGVGPKTAARILSELKDKGGPAPPAAAAQRGAAANAAERTAGEAVSALVNLGYARGEAHAAVARVAAGSADGDLAGLVRRGLRELAVN